MFEAEANDKMVLHCPAVAVFNHVHPVTSQVTVRTIYRRNLTAELFNLFIIIIII